MLHVFSFCCTITTKGRSKVYEEYNDPVTRVDEALLVLSSVERGDEGAPERVASRASAEIVKLAAQLKITTVVLRWSPTTQTTPCRTPYRQTVKHRLTPTHGSPTVPRGT